MNGEALKFKESLKNKCSLIAEIGINHNGNIETAKKLIDMSAAAGFDSVKFQKRDLELCIPNELRGKLRLTPWGEISYWDYKNKIEFNYEQYLEIDRYCKEKSISWSASAWDINSFNFLMQFDLPYIKIPSDKARDLNFLKLISNRGVNYIVSTGGCDKNDVDQIVKIFEKDSLTLLQCTSIYPADAAQLNLALIDAMATSYGVPVGFSSHHTSPILAAMSVPMGAKVVEVHVTLDRAMWGTDQSMSLERRGCEILVKSVRLFEAAIGSGKFEIFDGERKTLSRTITS